MQIPTWIQSIGLWLGVAIAAVLIGLAVFVFRRGLLNTVLWLVGLAAAAIGVINRISYGK